MGSQHGNVIVEALSGHGYRPRRANAGGTACCLTCWARWPTSSSSFNLVQFADLPGRRGGGDSAHWLSRSCSVPMIIGWLKQQQPGGQPIREDGPRGHFKKAGTPTMGGFLILLAIIVSTLLWADSAQRICLGAAADHGRVRCDRLCGRLPEAHPLPLQRASPGRVRLLAEVVVAGRRHLLDHAPDAGPDLPPAWPCRSRRTS